VYSCCMKNVMLSEDERVSVESLLYVCRGVISTRLNLVSGGKL
jgi:hypothetical protein